MLVGYTVHSHTDLAQCARCKEIQHRCFEVSMKQQTLQEEQAGLK